MRAITSFLFFFFVFSLTMSVRCQSILELEIPDSLYKSYDRALVMGDTAKAANKLSTILDHWESSHAKEADSLLIRDLIKFSNANLEETTKVKIYSRIARHFNMRTYDYFDQGSEEVLSNKYFEHLDNAWYWLQKTVPLIERDTTRWGWIYFHLGNNLFMRFRATGEGAEQAISYFDEAINRSHYTNNFQLRIYGLLWKARVFIKQNRFEKADSLIDLTEKFQADTNALAHTSMIWDAKLALIYQRDSIPEIEQLVYKKTEALKELSRSKVEQALAESDRRYETQKTKRELAQQAKINDLQKAQLNQRNLIISIVVLLLLGAGGGSFFLYRLNTKNRKLAENNAMLVKEQNHRVKNNLQMISSLLSLQADRSTDSSRETMLDSSRRVQAIALLHRKLYDDLEGVKEVEMKPYIEELIEDILFATGKQDVPHRLNLDDVKLPVEKAVHLALILNELVTNSLKHVFSRERLNGECIELSLSKPNGKIELSYRDYGGSFDVEAFKNSDSLGNQIIQSQAKYLANEYAIREVNGLVFEMKI